MLENSMRNAKDDEEIIKTEKNIQIRESTPESIQRLKRIATDSSPLSAQEKDINNNKEIAALSYVWILSIPIFLFRKDSAYVQKHAKQGLILFIISLFFWLLSTFPFIGWLGVILLMLYIFIIVNSALKALIGEFYYVPILTDLLQSENKQDLSSEDDADLFKSESDTEIMHQIEENEQEEHQTREEISRKVHTVLPELEDKEDKSSLT